MNTQKYDGWAKNDSDSLDYNMNTGLQVQYDEKKRKTMQKKTDLIDQMNSIMNEPLKEGETYPEKRDMVNEIKQELNQLDATLNTEFAKSPQEVSDDFVKLDMDNVYVIANTLAYATTYGAGRVLGSSLMHTGGSVTHSLSGATLGAGGDLGLQLYQNDFDISKINWNSVILSAGVGSTGVKELFPDLVSDYGKNAFKVYKSDKRTIFNTMDKHKVNIGKDLLRATTILGTTYGYGLVTDNE